MGLAEECAKYRAGDLVIYEVPENVLDGTHTVVCAVVLKVERMRILLKSIAYINAGDNYAQIHFDGHGEEYWHGELVWKMTFVDGTSPVFQNWRLKDETIRSSSDGAVTFLSYERYRNPVQVFNILIDRRGYVRVNMSGDFSYPQSPHEILTGLYTTNGWFQAVRQYLVKE